VTTLDIDAVSVRFGRTEVLRDVSFDVHAGEVVSLIGPNGAGKTTLFNVMTGVVTPTAGEVRLDGHRISGRNPASVCRAGIGRTWQIARPFPDMSLEENVLVAGGAHQFNRLWRAVRKARTDERLVAARKQLEEVGLPGPYERNAADLPVGYLRLLEVARVLATEPKVVLLDEPAAGLRGSEVEQLEEVISGLRRRGLAVLLVEHNVPMAMRAADRVVVLTDGRVIADSDPRTVRESPEVIAAYLGEANA